MTHALLVAPTRARGRALGLHALVASFTTPAVGHEHLITFGILRPAARLEPVLISNGLGRGWWLIAARKAR